MIVTELHEPSGFGNQIWNYAVTRTIATYRNLDFGIIGKENWKGRGFINPDFGKPIQCITNFYEEKRVINNDVLVTPADINMINVPDNTQIEGIMQSVKYIQHRKKDICEWLKPNISYNGQYSNENYCIIHFRGGDYRGAGRTLLPQSYYFNAMNHMKNINKDMKFAVVTDDIELAYYYFGGIAEIIGSSITGVPDQYKSDYHYGGNIAIDYNIINNAKYIILSNSTFGWWATWTNQQVKKVIAPLYWFAYNYTENFWAGSEMRVEEDNWVYLDREGNVA
jgi:hypothetical protein